MSTLEDQLRQLVKNYGLDVVYDTLRNAFNFCSNCGTPLTGDVMHVPANLGMCYVERGEGDDGEA